METIQSYMMCDTFQKCAGAISRAGNNTQLPSVKGTNQKIEVQESCEDRDKWLKVVFHI
jgi:hypothetical protein